MKEKIYSIPVNDAFNAECECPVCSMYKTLEDNAVEYTMGPSYMEDDTRALTDENGFCKRHMQMIYESGNKLGIALIMKTHFDRVLKDITPLSDTVQVKKRIFGKSEVDGIERAEYLDKLNSSCFVCNRINNVFDRYIDTIFFLWKGDNDFKKKFSECKGFCNEHYSLLLKEAHKRLSGQSLEDFCSVLSQLYISNMERVRDDLDWFINKFDYRYADEPWKNSKDAIPRAMTKTNGIIVKEQ